MKFVLGSAIVAGLIATLVMTLFMYMAKAMGMPRTLGLMFTGPQSTGVVYALGLIAHFMIGAIFGIVYAWLFRVFGVSANWLWGGIFGAVHGVIAGLFIGMMPLMLPRMGPNKPTPSPGFFGRI